MRGSLLRTITQHCCISENNEAGVALASDSDGHYTLYERKVQTLENAPSNHSYLISAQV